MKDNIPGFMGYYVSVGDRVIRNILNNSYENKESRGSKR